MAEIPIDSEHVSFILLKREKRIIGKAAVDKGYRSMGEYIRFLVQTGLEIEDAELARRYRQARALRYAMAVGLCIIGGFTVFQSLTGDLNIRRSSTRTHVVQVKKVEA